MVAHTIALQMTYQGSYLTSLPFITRVNNNYSQALLKAFRVITDWKTDKRLEAILYTNLAQKFDFTLISTNQVISYQHYPIKSLYAESNLQWLRIEICL